MKRYLYLFISVTFLFALSFLLTNYTHPEKQSEKIAEIEKYIKKVERISPFDTSFEDFSFLKDFLRDKDIVMLGEQTHFDGATFLAKSRLIKYLHQELGFDVLLYEAGLYDTERLWQTLKSKENNSISDFLKALYPFWCENRENEELMKYILKNIGSGQELEIAGFDVQFTGNVKNHERDSVLNRYIASQPQINDTLFPAFFSIKNRYSSYVNKWQVYKFTETKKDSILNDIQTIKNILSAKEKQNSDDSLYVRFFNNLETLYGYSWKYDIGEDIRFHLRDSAMADNFIWLKEQKYKNRKVIIWAANMHTSYSNSCYNPAFANFTPMGEHIKNKYGERVYSINFTSYSHESNLSDSEKIYSNKSLEYLLHQLGTPYLFLHFNDIDKNSFLRKELIMNCNQGFNLNARWSEMTDAIFYIDKMTGLNNLE